MVRLEEKLRKEKEKLEEMIANFEGDLTNDLILEQSRKVDHLIVSYQKIKMCCLSLPVDDIKCKINKNNI